MENNVGCTVDILNKNNTSEAENKDRKKEHLAKYCNLASEQRFSPPPKCTSNPATVSRKVGNATALTGTGAIAGGDAGVAGVPLAGDVATLNSADEGEKRRSSPYPASLLVLSPHHRTHSFHRGK